MLYLFWLGNNEVQPRKKLEDFSHHPVIVTVFTSLYGLYTQDLFKTLQGTAHAPVELSV